MVGPPQLLHPQRESAPVRLAKRVAAMVPCSRREAEQYIAGGWVRVDGVVIEEPQFRVGDHKVELDPGASPAALEPVSLLLHKPAGIDQEDAQRLLAPANRAADDRSAIRTLKQHLARLAPLLTLPSPASGLAVYSQDGRVIRKLTQDALHIEQELVAEVSGELAPDGLRLICHGLVFEGRPLPPIKASWQSEKRLRFAIKGIPPALVPWMCEQVGLRVGSLKRIRIGRLAMAGLQPSQWRYMEPGERF